MDVAIIRLIGKYQKIESTTRTPYLLAASGLLRQPQAYVKAQP
jgi:hypothetical protein